MVRSPLQTPLKISSILLSLIVFAANSLLAYSVESNFWLERKRIQPSIPAVTKTVIPAHLGRSRTVFKSNGAQNERVVFHIQDVHMHGEAQKNIGELIRQLIEQKRVDLVALEGAFEPIDVTSIRKAPYQDTIQRVADYFLRINKLSGPVHTAVTSRQPIPVFTGIDDRAGYDANVEAYRQAAPLQQKVKNQIEARRRELTQRKKEIFNPALLAFDENAEAYLLEKIEFGVYAKNLKTHVSSLSPTIASFLSALELENKLDFTAVEKERTDLLTHLSQKLSKPELSNVIGLSLSYQTGSLSAADFFKQIKTTCERNGISLQRYSSFQSYLDYIALADGIDGDVLFSEIKKTEQTIYTKLIRNPTERDLVEQSRYLGLTDKLTRFALTKEEWESYRTTVHSLWTIDHRPNFSSFEKFYEQADARDSAMSRNLLKAMATQNAKQAVLVTGGFHSKGIAEHLKKENVTLISFIPKITQIDSGNGSAYLSVFTQEKTPLEKIFEGKKLFLPDFPHRSLPLIPPVTAAFEAPNNTPEKVLNDFDSNLKGEPAPRTDTPYAARIIEEDKVTTIVGRQTDNQIEDVQSYSEPIRPPWYKRLFMAGNGSRTFYSVYRDSFDQPEEKITPKPALPDFIRDYVQLLKWLSTYPVSQSKTSFGYTQPVQEIIRQSKILNPLFEFDFEKESLNKTSVELFLEFHYEICRNVLIPNGYYVGHDFNNAIFVSEIEIDPRTHVFEGETVYVLRNKKITSSKPLPTYAFHQGPFIYLDANVGSDVADALYAFFYELPVHSDPEIRAFQDFARKQIKKFSKEEFIRAFVEDTVEEEIIHIHDLRMPVLFGARIGSQLYRNEGILSRVKPRTALDHLFNEEKRRDPEIDTAHVLSEIHAPLWRTAKQQFPLVDFMNGFLAHRGKTLSLITANRLQLSFGAKTRYPASFKIINSMMLSVMTGRTAADIERNDITSDQILGTIASFGPDPYKTLNHFYRRLVNENFLDDNQWRAKMQKPLGIMSVWHEWYRRAMRLEKEGRNNRWNPFNWSPEWVVAFAGFVEDFVVRSLFWDGMAVALLVATGGSWFYTFPHAASALLLLIKMAFVLLYPFIFATVAHEGAVFKGKNLTPTPVATFDLASPERLALFHLASRGALVSLIPYGLLFVVTLFGDPTRSVLPILVWVLVALSTAITTYYSIQHAQTNLRNRDNGGVIGMTGTGSQALHQLQDQLQTATKTYLMAFALKLTRNHADAEDLVQETFLRAWRYFQTHTPREKGLKSFLQTILHNKFLDNIKQRKRMNPVILDKQIEESVPNRPSFKSIAINPIINALNPLTASVLKFISQHPEMDQVEVAKHFGKDSYQFVQYHKRKARTEVDRAGINAADYRNVQLHTDDEKPDDNGPKPPSKKPRRGFKRAAAAMIGAASTLLLTGGHLQAAGDWASFPILWGWIIVVAVTAEYLVFKAAKGIFNRLKRTASTDKTQELTELILKIAEDYIKNKKSTAWTDLTPTSLKLSLGQQLTQIPASPFRSVNKTELLNNLQIRLTGRVQQGDLEWEEALALAETIAGWLGEPIRMETHVLAQRPDLYKIQQLLSSSKRPGRIKLHVRSTDEAFFKAALTNTASIDFVLHDDLFSDEGAIRWENMKRENFSSGTLVIARNQLLQLAQASQPGALSLLQIHCVTIEDLLNDQLKAADIRAMDLGLLIGLTRLLMLQA